MGEEMDSQKFWARLQSVGGASIVTLYEGPPLLHQVTHATYLEPEHYMSSSKSQNWTWGCIFLFGHCISWAGWMVLQAPLLKKHPAKLTLTSFTCFFRLIQFLAIAAFVETDINRWKIQSGEELFTIFYAGIVASGIVLSLQTCKSWGNIFSPSFHFL